MNTHAVATKDNKSQAVANNVSKPQMNGEALYRIEDNRPKSIQQRIMQAMMDDSPRVTQPRVFQMIMDHSSSAQSKIQNMHIPPGDPMQLKTTIKHILGTISVNGTNQTVGRAVKANLDPKDPKKGSEPPSKNSDWMQWIRSQHPKADVVRGHLLNHDLGGRGIEENLYPISKKANGEHSARIEQNVKGALSDADKDGGRVEYNVSVNDKKSYEQAEFVCNWILFDNKGKTKRHDEQTITSDLGNDAGAFRGKQENKNQQSPEAWKHGKSRESKKGAKSTDKESSDSKTKGGTGSSAGIIGDTKEGISSKKPFDLQDLKLPGPIKITKSTLETFDVPNGIGVTGQLDFEVNRVGKGELHATKAATEGKVQDIEIEGKFEFESSFFSKAEIGVNYKNKKFYGNGILEIQKGKVKGIESASINVNVDDANWSANGDVKTNIPGVKKGTVNAKFEQGKGFDIAGTLALGDDIPAIQDGSMDLSISKKEDGKYALKGNGNATVKIPGMTANINATYDDGLFYISGTANYKKGMLSGNLNVGVTNGPVDKNGNPQSNKPGTNPGNKLTAFGGGSVTAQLAPWLIGTVEVQIRPDGKIEAGGVLAISKPLELFPEKKLDKDIFTINVDFPIFGFAFAGQRVGIFATVGGGLKLIAGIGPGQLSAASLAIKYNPDNENQTKVSGKAAFVIPAHAGLRLFVRGGVGAGLLIVSATGSLEIGGELGLAGEARADVDVDWSPNKGLTMEALGSILMEPKFKFDIGATVSVDANLLFMKKNLYEKHWEFAALEYGSGMQLGLKFPIKYQQGKLMDISFNNVEFIYPKIDKEQALKILKDLTKNILS